MMAPFLQKLPIVTAIEDYACGVILNALPDRVSVEGAVDLLKRGARWCDGILQ